MLQLGPLHCAMETDYHSLPLVHHADLDVNRRISFRLEGRMQPLLLHAGLHPHQDGLNLPWPLSYATAHLASACMWHIVWYAALHYLHLQDMQQHLTLEVSCGACRVQVRQPI